MIFSSYKSYCYQKFVKTATMQIVSARSALNCLFLQLFIVLEFAIWTLSRHTNATAAAQLAQYCCVRIFCLFCFLLAFVRFKIAELDRLRARIAELESTNDADDAPMQIDADDDDVVILEAFSPVSAAVSTAANAAASDAAVAKKVSID